ncbi:MAG TPA: putative porin [Verrucomicrobiae bacterium]|nr:putative porin [Verrucomicrobiae bacterium]
MKKHRLKKAGLLATAAVAALVINSRAQSVDSLLDKLVDKGILTVKEANELRAESDKDFDKTYAAKTGLPDWVNGLKFNGDVRVRYENFTSDNPAFIDRNRFRFRLRFGAIATLMDDFEAGFRLTSSEQQGAFGGDPISGNATFTDNGSKKFIYIDQAYGKWSPLKGPHLSGSLTAGKMENPFVFSDMVFDQDYTPEGLAMQSAYRINDAQTMQLIGGAFVLDEVGGSSDDAYLYGVQARLDSTWTPKVKTSAGVAGLLIQNDQSLVNGAVPNINRGNDRNAATAPSYNFNPIVADASLTYTLESGPLYTGPFPIKVGGDFIINPAAPSSSPSLADDYGYSAGVVIGKSGKKGTWELAYTWKYLGGNAWWEELVDSDFGAFYQVAQVNSGLGAGYGSGTGVQGHIVKLAYSPYDSITLSAKWFRTELINGSQPGSDSTMNRVQVDALWRF